MGEHGVNVMPTGVYLTHQPSSRDVITLTLYSHLLKTGKT